MTKNYKQFKEELLKDKTINRAYNDLLPEFALIETVIEKRLEKGISQQELAQRIGTKQSAISRFESGGYNPTVAFLQKMAKAMNLRVNISLVNE